MAPTKYQRLAPGESCEECSTRLWYAQDGLRYCKNGHQLEGFAPHDAGEDEYGTTGKVSRKHREKHERVVVKLEGAAGMELYLECLQQILRRQLWWLIKTVGFPDELELVVKQLWTLRVRELPLKILGQDRRADATDGSLPSVSQGSQSETETEMETDTQMSDATTATTRTWDQDPRYRWKVPKLIDTLALCYLGCLILRHPVTTADLHIWAQRGDIEFLAAINGIPKNVQDRLPSAYHASLQIRDHIKPGRLLNAAQALAIAFNTTFELKLPPLNYIPILVRYLKELTLPLDLYATVQCLAEILDITDYCYPTGETKRIRSMDNPEVLLLSLVIVSTKLLHPLDQVNRPPASHDDPRVAQIDWTEWAKAMESKDPVASDHHLQKGTEYQITANQSLALEKTKLDDWMDWYERTWLGGADEAKTPPNIRELFRQDRFAGTPTQSSSPDIRTSNETDVELIKERYRILNSTMKIAEPQPDPEPIRIRSRTRRRVLQERDLFPVWRTEDDLPQAAKIFYQKAADLAAIPLRILVIAATQVERRLELWCLEQDRREEKEVSDPKGKGRAVAMDEAE